MNQALNSFIKKLVRNNARQTEPCSYFNVSQTYLSILQVNIRIPLGCVVNLPNIQGLLLVKFPTNQGVEIDNICKSYRAAAMLCLYICKHKVVLILIYPPWYNTSIKACLFSHATFAVAFP